MNKLLKNKFLHFFLIFMFYSNFCFGVSFVTVGHLYPITNNKILLNQLIEKINSHNPDFIFVLGDSDINNKEVYNLFIEKFENKVFFTPGNHEVGNKIEKYFTNVGYNNKIIESENSRFILINSNESIYKIKSYLKKNISNNNKINIIFTHHRIWDDSLTSQYPGQHDKSFYFKELYPILKNNVKAIFAGNSRNQYFKESLNTPYEILNYNPNIMYWMDKIGSIECYSIGNSRGNPKTSFMYVKIKGQEFNIKTDYVSMIESDLIPISKIKKNKSSVTPDNIKFYLFGDNFQNKLNNFYFKVSKRFVLLIGFLLGIFFSACIIFIKIKKL